MTHRPPLVHHPPQAAPLFRVFSLRPFVRSPSRAAPRSAAGPSRLAASNRRSPSNRRQDGDRPISATLNEPRAFERFCFFERLGEKKQNQATDATPRTRRRSGKASHATHENSRNRADRTPSRRKNGRTRSPA